MTVRLDHTIVAATDNRASATFLAEVLGLPAPPQAGPFMAVTVGNGVALDYMNVDGDVRSQHYAFSVDDAEFDDIFGRIRPGEIRERDGTGRDARRLLPRPRRPPAGDPHRLGGRERATGIEPAS